MGHLIISVETNFKISRKGLESNCENIINDIFHTIFFKLDNVFMFLVFRNVVMDDLILSQTMECSSILTNMDIVFSWFLSNQKDEHLFNGPWLRDKEALSSIPKRDTSKLVF